MVLCLFFPPEKLKVTALITKRDGSTKTITTDIDGKQSVKDAFKDTVNSDQYEIQHPNTWDMVVKPVSDSK